MKKALQQVTEFHKAFGHTIALDQFNPAHGDAKGLAAARQSWVEEEHREILEKGFQGESLAELADGLVDLRYFMMGNAVAFGINPDEATIRSAVFDKLSQVVGSMRYAFGPNSVTNNMVPEARAYNLAVAEIIVQGIAAVYGIPLDEAFTFVHENGNMAKLVDGKPVYKEDGKVKKPDDWVAPDLKLLVGDGAPIAGVPVKEPWLPIDDYAKSGATVLLKLRKLLNVSVVAWFDGKGWEAVDDWWRADEVGGYRRIPG